MLKRIKNIKAIKKIGLIALAVSLIMPLFPIQTIEAADEKYDHTFSGIHEKLIVLGTGTYLFDNVTVTGRSSTDASAVMVLGHAKVDLKGTNTVTGADATGEGPNQTPSGAGFLVEHTDNNSISLTLNGIGDDAVLNVKGGNAGIGQKGYDGRSGDERGFLGVGGIGGNGASAAIGALGGTGSGTDESVLKGQDSGRIELLGGFTLNATGGVGGAGGAGGSGGQSNSSYALLWTDLKSGGGGGGGGGGGFPAAAIGGGGAAGAQGGNGTTGEHKQPSPLRALVGSNGGGGGGGGRGWGAGGGGGSGFFAFLQGDAKSSTLRPKGGIGGLSPTDTTPGRGGTSGLMDASSGVGSRAEGMYSLSRYSAYPGDGPNASRGARGTGGQRYDVDITDFKLQDGENQYASDPGGLARRYEHYQYSGKDGDKGGKSKRGRAKVDLVKSDRVIINADGAINGDGGGTDAESARRPIISVIDLSDPGTKVTFDPVNAVYNGTEVTPKVKIVSASGIVVDEQAYEIRVSGSKKNAGKVPYTFVGKDKTYAAQRVVNETEREFEILKAERKDRVTAGSYSLVQNAEVTLSLVDHTYDDANITWTVDPVGGDGSNLEITKVEAADGINNVIRVISGYGVIKVKVNIAEGPNHKAFTTDEISILVGKAGAEAFVVEGLNAQTYTGKAIEPPFDVYYAADKLTKGIDYDVSYDKNINVGYGRALITAKGRYEGTLEAWFPINPASIKNIKFANASYEGSNGGILPNLEYTTGSQKSSPIGANLAGFDKLVEGTDYTLTYSETVEVGEVTVSVNGINNFGGTVQLTYNILPADISKMQGIDVIKPSDVIYNGKAQDLKPRVLLKNNDLKEGEDYTLSYSDNIDVGKATITIHGKGRFKTDSSIDSNFNITKKDIFIVPKADQKKSSGEKDPDELDYTIEGIEDKDKVKVVEGSKLSRMPGELIGLYLISRGNVELAENEVNNANYSLELKENENFEITAYQIEADATIEGTLNDETGWYVENPNDKNPARLVAPDDYLISRTSELDDENPPADYVSPWQGYIELSDGDYSDGLTYFLKEKIAKNGIKHISQPKSIKYKQDREPVEARINLNEKKIFNKFKKGLDFKMYFNSDVPTQIITEDAASGIDSVQYLLSDTEKSVDDLKAVSDADWTAATNGKMEFDLANEEKAIIYVKAKDKAGHTTYVNTNGFIVDKTKPTVALTYKSTSDEGTWVADPNIKVTALIDEKLSGIMDRYLDYHFVYKDNRESDVKILELDENNEALINDFPDGEYNIIVSAKDNAENIGTNKVLIKKDTMKPTLQLDIEPEKYETSKDITFKPTVGFSGVNKIFVQRQNFGVDVDEGGIWQEITLVDGKHNVKLSGSYYMYYENGAGVKSNIASISTDRIDNEMPVIKVKATSGGNDIATDTWSGKDVEVAFENTNTKNRGQTTFSYRVKVGEAATGTWGDWVNIKKGNDYTGKALISLNGRTEIELKVTSEAGLASSEPFITKVDKQLPTGEITKGSNVWDDLIDLPNFDDIFNTNQTYVFTGNDALSGMNAIQYLVVTGEDAKKAYDGEGLEELAVTLNGWIPGSSVTVDKNERYVIYTRLSDKVGNVRYLSSAGAIRDDEKPTMDINTDAIEDIDGQQWIIRADATIPLTLSDTLSGPSHISYNDGNGDVKLDASAGTASINNLKEGKYNLTIKGYDKAGNEVSETLAIQKDSADPKIQLEADTESFAKKQDIKITPIVGASGLKSLRMKFVGNDGSTTGWKDITTAHANGYTVTKKGTFTIEMEDNLGRKDNKELVFNNIEYIDPVVKVDAVDEDGTLMTSDNWYSAVYVRFYNDPVKVSKFKYEYRKDATNDWEEVVAKDGYALVKAENGQHTYHVRVTNLEDNKVSAEKEITLKVDANKPKGTLTLTSDTPSSWTSVPNDNTFSIGLNTSATVKLGGVSDVTPGSGIEDVSYYVLTGGKNKPVKDYPKNEAEVKTQLVGKWLPVTGKALTELKDGKEIVLETLQDNQSYMVFAKIRDLSGNVSYIATAGISIDDSKPIVSTDYVDGKWLISDSEVINVSVDDNLSTETAGYYIISDGSGNSDSHNFTTSNAKFKIDASKLYEGTNRLSVNVEDLAGNAADIVTQSILKDTVVPTLSVANDETTADVNITRVVFTKMVGASAVKSLIMTNSNNDDKVDVTDKLTTGVRIFRNGTYYFTLTNNAGVSSNVAKITYRDLGNPPEVVVEAYKTKGGAEYEEGTWSDAPITLKLSTREIVVGNVKYEYSIDKGQNWTHLSNLNDEITIEIDDPGEHHYQFRATTPAGAVSDVLSYNVNISFDQPVFTYDITPKNVTAQWVDLVLTQKKESNEKIEYSFDGGVTFEDTNKKRFTSNGYIQVVARSETGATMKETIHINTIDRLAPVMTIYKNQVSNDKMYSISMEVNDARENAEFIETGINQVFITSVNPFGEIDIRTIPAANDYVLEKGTSGRYETNNEFKAAKDGNEADNYWIVSTDKVGNYNIKSFKVTAEGGSGEIPNPDNPGSGGSGGDTVDKPIDTEETIEETIMNTYNDTINKLINKLMKKQLPDNWSKFNEEKNLLKKLSEMELTSKQRKLVEARLSELNGQQMKLAMPWIIIILLGSIGGIFIYRERKMRKNKNEKLENRIQN